MPLFQRIAMPALVALALAACKEQEPPPAAEAPGPLPAPAVPAPRIATVDVQRVFKESRGTLEAQKEINIERARIQEENNQRLTRIRALETDLEELKGQLDDPALPASRRQGISNALATGRQEGIALDRERREFLQRRNQALKERTERHMKGILDDIRRRVEEMAKAGDYDYVFDRSAESASQTPFFLATPHDDDFTGALLEQMSAPSDGSVEADAGGGAGDRLINPD